MTTRSPGRWEYAGACGPELSLAPLRHHCNEILIMKLSELIVAYGDEKVELQNLDQCAEKLNMSGGFTKITFGTVQPLNPFSGTEKLGLVVWLDRARVKEIIAASNSPDAKLGD
jgi:hypothetical protein